MLEIAICDDVKEDRDLLMDLVNRMIDLDLDCNFHISSFSCGEDLENHYEEGKSPFDIIFLDIYMTGKTGLETARQIRKKDNACKIIFTTTSTCHALEGYSVFAYNYLVKPINPQVFTPILKKAVHEAYTEKEKNLCVKAVNKVQSIRYKDIKYIESQGKIIRIFMINGKEISSYMKLDEIESMLVEQRFLRCHKSFLLNMDYVESVEKYQFTLGDYVKVPIRQREFSSIKRQYYEFIVKKLD